MSALAARPERRLTLRPEEVVVVDSPAIITTVLGSCVAVCLVSQREGVGAMSHSLLPLSRGRGGDNPGRFVDTAIEAMLDALRAAGVRASTLRAGVFGGADRFPPAKARGFLTVGRQNIDVACRLLHARGIPVVADNTGGGRGRKIIFNTGLQEVFLVWLGQQAVRQAA